MSSKVEFNTRHFEFSHQRAPRGRGSWAFTPRNGDTVLSPSMSYADAKKWVKARFPNVDYFDVNA